MIKINLLPHREAKRKERMQAFVLMLAAASVLGVLIVLAVGGIFESEISTQTARNSYIQKENTRLDGQIKEIASLKQEIDALKARQQAVEDLQSDRNQPVYLMTELVKQVPEGIYLRGFKQEGQRVVVNGYAQSNDRVSTLLHNMSNNSPWLERPDLIEIRSATVGTGRELKHVFDFTVNVGIKRPSENTPAIDGTPGVTTVGAPAGGAVQKAGAAVVTPTAAKQP
ncbi:PilN domain-containing protein [Glaciimonas soli]|uniref:Fimbrial assembly protein n=1 Tax=Glaciimonas soli TaxID=2590999 RepID=A0A843YSY2_9BURK|nr:PilN domain-containing protein [Glaciimonas soli]MQR02685.1 fimbrial assembly protein [Glaciimonas soli]